jgi:hypothetical protein
MLPKPIQRLLTCKLHRTTDVFRADADTIGGDRKKTAYIGLNNGT